MIDRIGTNICNVQVEFKVSGKTYKSESVYRADNMMAISAVCGDTKKVFKSDNNFISLAVWQNIQDELVKIDYKEAEPEAPKAPEDKVVTTADMTLQVLKALGKEKKHTFKSKQYVGNDKVSFRLVAITKDGADAIVTYIRKNDKKNKEINSPVSKIATPQLVTDILCRLQDDYNYIKEQKKA